MILEIRHLRLVVNVARESTLTAAARRLHVSQPALSRQLSDLEDRLGLALFHRQGRSMRPTAACRRLLPTAEDVLRRVELEERDLQRMANGQAGTVRLTTECYTCYRWLPRILTRFKAKHPGIDIEIDTSATGRPLEALLEGEIDLAIASSPVEDDDLVWRRLFTDELIAIMAPRHRLAGRKILSPGDFEGEHLVLYSEEGSDLINDVLRPAGVEPAKVSALQITDGIIELVKAGIGISVVANWACRENVESGALAAARVTRRGMKRRWKAVVSKATAALPHIATLIDLIAESRLSGFNDA